MLIAEIFGKEDSLDKGTSACFVLCFFFDSTSLQKWAVAHIQSHCLAILISCESNRYEEQVLFGFVSFYSPVTPVMLPLISIKSKQRIVLSVFTFPVNNSLALKNDFCSSWRDLGEKKPYSLYPKGNTITLKWAGMPSGTKRWILHLSQCSLCPLWKTLPHEQPSVHVIHITSLFHPTHSIWNGKNRYITFVIRWRYMESKKRGAKIHIQKGGCRNMIYLVLKIAKLIRSCSRRTGGT